MASLGTLLVLADSRLPTGGHVHSGGVEEAVVSGRVADIPTLRAFLVRRIRSHGLVAASLAAAVHDRRLTVDDAEHEADARTPSAAARRASRAQGRGLIRLARRVCAYGVWAYGGWDTLGPAPHLAVAAGVVGKVSGITPDQTAIHVVYTTMTGSATAGQRLLALDPADVASLTFELSSLCEQTAAEACGGLADLSDPLLDQLAERHATRERPLFVS